MVWPGAAAGAVAVEDDEAGAGVVDEGVDEGGAAVEEHAAAGVVLGALTPTEMRVRVQGGELGMKGLWG